MIKALIFDCFGLFYSDPVLAYVNEPSTLPDKARALHALDEKAARGDLDKRSFVTQAAQLIGITEGESEQRFFHSNQRNESLMGFVAELRKKYKVAMLSNIGGDMMDGFFTPNERQRLFDITILSGDTKMAKPDRGIFELTCKRLGVELNETVMIDDIQATCDVVKTFGMKGVCYKNLAQCKIEVMSILVQTV